MKKNYKEDIKLALNNKGAINPCHRCGSDDFGIVDGFSMLENYEFDKNLSLIISNLDSAAKVPYITVGCSNCGNLSFHAIGALGLSK